MAQQPALSIVLLAALAVLGGALAFSLGLLEALLVGLADTELLALGLVLVVLGALFVLSGMGLYRLDPWAWWLALGLCGFSLAAVAIGWYGWMSGVIPTVVLVYLFTVKDEFRIGRRRTAGRAEKARSGASRRRKRKA